METREATERFRLAQWAENIQERTASGELVEEFCLRKGMSKHQYYYWQQKLRKAAANQIAKLESPPTDITTARGFTEVRLRESLKSSEFVESGQICIETISCRITAGSAYPAESIAVVLREAIKP